MKMKQVNVPKLTSMDLARGKLSLNSNYYWDKSLLVNEEKVGFPGPSVMGTRVHCHSHPGEERNYEFHVLVPGPSLVLALLLTTTP